MTLDETRNGFEHIFICNRDVIDKVHEDVIDVRVPLFGADELKGIEDIGDKTVRFGDEVLSGVDIAANTARSNKSSNEEPTIELVLSGDTVIDVELLAFCEQRGEVVV